MSFSTWDVHTERENKCSFEPPTPLSCGILTIEYKSTRQASKSSTWSGILISSTTVYTLESSNYVNSQIIMHQQTQTTSFVMVGIKGRTGLGTLKEGIGFTRIHP